MGGFLVSKLVIKKYPNPYYSEMFGTARYFKVHYRPGTSDLRIMQEVIEKRCYRKAKSHFDVEPGETWLDLGANIGAFAVYARMRGARMVECFEPDPRALKILSKNADWACIVNSAVTAEKVKTVKLHYSDKPLGRWQRTSSARMTVIPNPFFTESFEVPNLYAGVLRSWKFSGVKMDVEGSEGPILDQWLLPRCNKLILEYHTSKDSSVENFVHRMDQLHKHFRNVRYPAEFDRAIKQRLKTFRAFFDRVIHAWEPK
jgi:FkbM family methyltransferase